MYPGVAQRMLSFSTWQLRRDEALVGTGGSRDLAAAPREPQAINFSPSETNSHCCDVSVLVFAGQLGREFYLQRVRPTVAEFGAI